MPSRKRRRYQPRLSLDGISNHHAPIVFFTVVSWCLHAYTRLELDHAIHLVLKQGGRGIYNNLPRQVQSSLDACENTPMHNLSCYCSLAQLLGQHTSCLILIHRGPWSILIFQALEHLAHHLVTHYLRLRKSRLKECLRTDEALLPRLVMAQAHTFRPASRRECKLEVITTVHLVFHGGPQRGIQQGRVAEEVFRHAKPQPEKRRAAEHVIVGHNVERSPAIHHGEQAEMIVRPRGRIGGFSQRKGRQDGGLDQRSALPARRRRRATKDLFSSGVDPAAEALEVAFEHELVQRRHTLGVLGDLLFGFGVQDGEPGVHVPFLAVDAEHCVDLDVLDAAHVAV